MSELDEAMALANRILDRPSADPDDDLCVLARQLVRATEAKDIYREHARLLRAMLDVRTREYRARCQGTIRDTKLDGEHMRAATALDDFEEKWGLKEKRP